MIDKNELCQKIQEIYPDIGECGIDVNVAFDQANQRWTVDLKKDSHQLKTFPEEGDIERSLFWQKDWKFTNVMRVATSWKWSTAVMGSWCAAANP